MIYRILQKLWQRLFQSWRNKNRISNADLTMQFNEEYIEEIMSKVKFKGFSPKIFAMLWKKFSEIQCATWMHPNKESMDRFTLWLKTGDDNDAWS